MNFKCLIVDDEPSASALLRSHIAHVDFLDHAMTCYDGYEALNFLRQHNVDIIFMDIELPEMSGMELADLLPGNVALIFTTAHSAYAAESYRKLAVDYLLKPITFAGFMEAVQKAVIKITAAAPIQPTEHTIAQKDYLFVKSGKKLIRLEYASILYIEGKKEYVNFHTHNGVILIYKRLKEIAEIAGNMFQRIHHSYIVNVHQIVKIEDNHVWIGNRRLPISDTYRKQFLSFIEKKVI
jgi:two-component system, LytTR family, response regulator